jgi:hypothetical protein
MSKFMATSCTRILPGTQIMLLLLALALAQCLWSSAVSAFMTFKWFGGAIHQHILDDALYPLGLSRASLKTIGKGTDSQDIPLTDKYTASPQNHCDDNQIQQGSAYWQERIKRAVVDAKNADTNPRNCHKALFEFGEGMHTVQDFYSHSNYLEWLLQNHKALEPVDWDNVPAAIRTGYYYYNRFLAEEAFVSRSRSVNGLQKQHQQLNLRSAAEYEVRSKTHSYTAALDYALKPGDLLHKELNKDSPKSLEGEIVAPQYGKTLHQLARQLATADSARQWMHFEQMIGAAYGARAPQIMVALKGHMPGTRQADASAK